MAHRDSLYRRKHLVESKSYQPSGEKGRYTCSQMHYRDGYKVHTGIIPNA